MRFGRSGVVWQVAISTECQKTVTRMQAYRFLLLVVSVWIVFSTRPDCAFAEVTTKSTLP